MVIDDERRQLAETDEGEGVIRAVRPVARILREAARAYVESAVTFAKAPKEAANLLAADEVRDRCSRPWGSGLPHSAYSLGVR